MPIILFNLINKAVQEETDVLIVSYDIDLIDGNKVIETVTNIVNKHIKSWYELNGDFDECIFSAFKEIEQNGLTVNVPMTKRDIVY